MMRVVVQMLPRSNMPILTRGIYYPPIGHQLVVCIWDINCTVSAASGYTGNCYAKINSVTFTQGTQNAIRLQVYDVAGNMANQTPSSIIQYDNTAPGSFALYSPTGYVNVQDPTVIMQFSMTGPSGINPSGVNYAFTTNGSSTPTNWQEVSGVYTDVNCINVAQMGQNGTFYARILNVPFDQDSGGVFILGIGYGCQNCIRIPSHKFGRGYRNPVQRE